MLPALLQDKASVVPRQSSAASVTEEVLTFIIVNYASYNKK